MRLKKSFKKIHRSALGICLAFCLIVAVLFTPASAAGSETYLISHNSPYYLKLTEISATSTDAFTQFLYGKVLNGETEISVPTAIAFPATYTDGEDTLSTVQPVYDWMFYDCPVLFHMVGLQFTRTRKSGGITCVAKISVEYTDNAADYPEQLRACERTAHSILKDIEGNDDLSEQEKALLIHDRLVILCAYDEENLLNDTIPHESYTMYGALVNHTAVCQGYALAYKYLLARVGIFSYICASDDINHAWNVVYIDGLPYHVDVTHDDPIDENPPYNCQGRVYHNHFLLTDAEYQALQRTPPISYVFELPQTPTDTRYCDAYWRDLTMEIMLIGDEMYYCEVDEYYSDECAVLKTASGDIVEEFYFDCCLREDTGDGIEFWEDYPMPDSLRCGAYMGYFLYSQPDGIYGYHLESGETRKFFGQPVANGMHEEDYFYVFGCSGGKVSYDVYATNLTYIPARDVYNFTTPIVSSQVTTVAIFDVNSDRNFDVLDLVKAKKMLAANQRRFINGCGQIGSSDSLVLIQRALLEE